MLGLLSGVMLDSTSLGGYSVRVTSGNSLKKEKH